MERTLKKKKEGRGVTEGAREMEGGWERNAVKE